ncbi:unnamed protein product [Chironomus riparius]|uniref:DNA-directed RNA polymerase III subunit RPC5 n=1 Tax=Chironomus riparius TaxID=315576 RepID=A0A9P0NGY3_9DIPT|nr:unnamed protein product [Chironomus riparius]
MIEEDDPIEEEIPVYLSKSLANNLNVIQFPIKNHLYNIDRSNITNCCYKPESKQVKIDFKLDTASRNYDAFKGDMLAKIADGNRASTSYDKNDHPTFTSGRMDKATYTSSIGVENPRYAVGFMEAGGLYLVPVKTFFQMRQTYSYFDKGDKRTKAEKGDMDEEEPEEDLKQVTVKFARTGDSEKIKKAREKSYRFISQIGKDEAWCETLIYPKHTAQSQLERHKISGINICSDISTGTNMSQDEYFDKLVNSAEAANSLDASLAQTLKIKEEDTKLEENNGMILHKGPISKRQTKKLPLLDQLKVILKDAKILSFNNLMEIMGSKEITTEKSDVLYPQSYVSSVNGISADLMCRGRDYILYKLIRNELMSLNRQKISAIIQLPQEETRDILESIACLKSNKTWDLLKPPDYDFEKRYPDICQRQETLWKAQEEKFLEMEAEKNEKRKRTRSVRESKV